MVAPRFSKASLISASAVATFVVVALSLIRHPGVPAYLHDWAWPPYGELLRSFAISKFSAWDWNGLGQPNVTLQVHPYFLLIDYLSFVMSTKAVLIVTLASALALGAAAVTASVLDVGGRRDAAFLAGLLFSLSPFTINQLIAGHVEVLVGASALPLAVWASLRPSSRAWVLIFALAWSTLHVQYAAILVGCVVILCGVSPFIACSWRLCLPLAIALPQLWTLLRPTAVTTEQPMLTTLPWLTVQSQPVESAITGAHYFARYWDDIVRSLPMLQATEWFYPACVAAALIAVRIGAFRILMLYIVAVGLLSGTEGPLAPALTHLARAVPAFSVFRELYHFAIILPLAAALAAGIAISFAPRAARVVIVSTMTLLLFTPFVTGLVWQKVPSVFSDPTAFALLRDAAGAPAPTRIFFAPGFSPVGPAAATRGGADPLAVRFGNAIALWSYRPTAPMPDLLWQLYQPRLLSDSLLASYAVSGVYERSELESKLQPNIPYLHTPNVPVFGQIQFDDRFTEVHGSASVLYRSKVVHPILHVTRSLASAQLQSPGMIFQAVNGDDPNARWVPAQEWWFFNPVVARFSASSVLTWARHATLALHCDEHTPSVVEITLRTFAFNANRLVAPARNMAMDCRSGATQTFSVAKGRYMLATADERSRLSEQADGEIAEALADFRFEPARIESRVSRGCSPCSLVLAVTFDPDWDAKVNGRSLGPARAAASASFGMRWTAPLQPGDTIVVSYRAQAAANALIGIASAAWLVIIWQCCVAVVTRAVNRRRQASA